MKDILYYVNRNRPLKYFNVVLLFFLLNGIAAKSSCRLDLSRDRVNSLTESTQKVLSGLKDPVLVEAYISREVPGEILSLILPVISLLEEIDRIGKNNIQLRIFNPTTEEETKMANARGIQGIPIEESGPDEIKQRLGFFGIYLQIGEKSTVINLVQDGRIIDDLEYRFLREIKYLIKTDRSSRIGFVTLPGSLETLRWNSPVDQRKDNLFAFRRITERDLGLMSDLNLKENIPSEIAVVIVTGLPVLSEIEKYRLDQFIMRGGSILFMLKGFEFQLQQTDPKLASLGLGGPGSGYATVPREELTRLNEWLTHYGISINGEILFEPDHAVAASDIRGQFIVPTPNPSWSIYSRESGNIKGIIPAMKNLEQLVFPWFSGISMSEKHQEGVHYSVLVESSRTAVKRSASSMDIKDVMKAGSSPGDILSNQNIPLAVHAKGKFQSYFSKRDLPADADPKTFLPSQTGGTESTIIAIGTPYMVSDILLRNESNTQIFRLNLAFIVNLIEAAFGDTDLIAARSHVQTISSLINTDKNFETIFKWFFIFTLPAILGIYGTLRLFRRNKRRGIPEGELG